MSWEVLTGDCLTLMHDFAPGSFDAVITDPPYSGHVHSNGMRGGRDSQGQIYGQDKDLGCDAISPKTIRDSARELARLTRAWVLVFSDVESSVRWRVALESAGLEYIRTGAWVKVAPTPQFSGDRPAAGFEAITIAHPQGRKTWNGGGRAAVWIFGSHGGELDTRYHAVQKPLPLMRILLTQFTDPGQTILDPFCGSGTTGVACVELGRNFVGIEISEEYATIARARIEAATRQQKLELM